MIKKKINIFIIFILISIFSIITYFAIDASKRRTVFDKLIGGYKLINYHIVGGHAFYRDFDAASDRILKYIEFSQKFSHGKNNMLQGIIDVTELISSKAYTQEEFNAMEDVYMRIDNISDDIYKNHIWLAKALSDTDIEKSKLYLSKALELSKSNEEVYREIIRIFSKNYEVKNLLKSYCNNYFNEFAGGTTGRIATSQTENRFFYGSNSNIGISRSGNYEKLYTKLISNLNVYDEYEFIFENEKDMTQFYILKNFFSGSKVSIKNIILHNNKKNRLDLNKLIIYSLGSYILDQSTDEAVFLNNNQNDDILKFYLNEKIEKIKKITFKLKLERLPLSSNLVCSGINEN